jgi:hypothetical protein
LPKLIILHSDAIDHPIACMVHCVTKMKCETEYLNRVNICKVREDILKVRKMYSVKIIKTGPTFERRLIIITKTVDAIPIARKNIVSCQNNECGYIN